MTDMEVIASDEEIVENSITTPYKKTYYSDVIGSPILDAVTGAKYPFKVGSKDEKKFFKVRSTLAYKNNSAKLEYPSSASTTNQAFYDNPESYMKHNGVVLSKDILDLWKLRHNVID